MKKYLYLTAVTKQLTDEAQERVDNYEAEPVNIVDSLGFNREKYEDMGIKPSEELLEKEKHFNSQLKLEDEDYEYVETEAIIDLKQFKFAVDIDSEGEDGCVIYLKENMSMSVAESSLQVYAQIEYLNRPWWKKLFKK